MLIERIELGNGVRRHQVSNTEERSAPVGSQLSSRHLTDQCLDLARDLGFSQAGVAHLEPMTDQELGMEEFLSRGFAGTMNYLARRDDDGRLERVAPKSQMKEAQCAICVALPYPPPLSTPQGARHQQSMQGKIAQYAQGLDYHVVMKERLLLLADQIAQLLGRPLLARACVDTAPVLERDMAVRAGFAFIGKNTLCITPGAGSHFLLGELFVDVALELPELSVAAGCGSCTACLDACPTDAFVGEYILDARKCISFITIESRDPIARQLRPHLGNHVFGCDLCQSSCPYNRSKKPRESSSALDPQPHLRAPQLIELLELGSSRYRRFVAKTALRRVSRHQLARNAAVALGNSASAEAIEPLRLAAIEHSSALVRSHCAWALGQLGFVHDLPEARAALESLQTSECPEVIKELKEWHSHSSNS